MARKDKVLEILALSGLSENVKLARLVRPWLGRPFPLEQAAAVIDCYFDANGRKPELVRKLVVEKARQEGIRNGRTAWAAAAKERARSPMLRYKGYGGEANKKLRTMEIAKSTFGPHVRENFNADALALMSLISGEDRWYEVKWLEASFKPVRCALIEVVTSGKVNICQRNTYHHRFLLYRINGRVLVARTSGRSLKAAWGGQLPEVFVAAAPALKEQGYSFRSDLEDQSMVVINPDGTEFRRVPWNGQTVDE